MRSSISRTELDWHLALYDRYTRGARHLALDWHLALALRLCAAALRRPISSGAAALSSKSGSSASWARRQSKDIFVREREAQGLRARSAFKLAQLDDKFKFLKPGAVAVDLGAAPGGWTEILVQRVRAGAPGGGRVVAADMNPMDDVGGATVLQLDMREEAAARRLREVVGPAGADAVVRRAPPCPRSGRSESSEGRA
eukprot:tig00021127_g18786.t1